MPPTSPPNLDLRTAADQLGVHYQTAYRWVRSGRLPAERVDGKYVVSTADVDAVRRRRTEPEAPTPPSRDRLGRSADRMYGAIVAGDEPAARRLTQRLVADGCTVMELANQVIVPSMVRIGESWHSGDLSIWEEHRATSIVERMLADVAPNPRGRRRGTAVVGAISGDHHGLPTTMATLALRSDQWHVHHLGADVPTAEMAMCCARSGADIAVITSTNPATQREAASAAEALAASVPTVLLGEPGRSLDDLLVAARSAMKSAPSRDRRAVAR